MDVSAFFSLSRLPKSGELCARAALRRVANAADVVVVIIGIVSKRTQQPDGERARARVRVRVSSRECFAEPCGGIADGRASADDSFGFEVNRTGPVRCELATLGARACACVQFLLVRHNCSSVPVFCGNQEKTAAPTTFHEFSIIRLLLKCCLFVPNTPNTHTYIIASNTWDYSATRERT